MRGLCIVNALFIESFVGSHKATDGRLTGAPGFKAVVLRDIRMFMYFYNRKPCQPVLLPCTYVALINGDPTLASTIYGLLYCVLLSVFPDGRCGSNG